MLIVGDILNEIEKKFNKANNLAKRMVEKHFDDIEIFFYELQFIFKSLDNQVPCFSNETVLNNSKVFSFINNKKFRINDKEFPVNYEIKWKFENGVSFLEGIISYTEYRDWEYYEFQNEVSMEYVKDLSYNNSNVEVFYKMIIFDILYYCFDVENIVWYDEAIVVDDVKIKIGMDWIYDLFR